MSRGIAPRAPTPGEVAAAWPRELAEVALLVLDSTDSTQRLARTLLDHELADDESTPAFLVAALEQTAGRGRRGRAWSSAAGRGIWASLLVRSSAAALPSVPMRSATALAEALGATGPAVRIKWPNDLVVGRRKLGGILVDAVTRSGGAFAVVGFGVNVAHRREELPTEGATSLRVELDGEPPPLGRLLADCAAALWRRLGDDDGDWLARYRELSAHAPGEELECDLDGERVAGRFLGFDEQGFLRLKSGCGERRISSGDVFRW